MSALGNQATQWRNTGKTVRFFMVDGRAMVFLLLAIYHISYWTAGLCVLGIALLTLLENKGYTLPNAARKLQILIIGKKKSAVTAKRLGRSDR